MKVTIIPADGVVTIDGRSIDGLDLKQFSNVHAVVWNGTRGEVQVLDKDGRISANVAITSLDAYAPAIAAWEAARQVLDAPPPPPPPQAPTVEDLFKQAIDAVQKHLDAFAATRGYDGILSLCTYANDPDPAYAAEGQRGVYLRSITWAAVRRLQAEILAGTRPLPETMEDALALLPPLTWEDTASAN